MRERAAGSETNGDTILMRRADVLCVRVVAVQQPQASEPTLDNVHRRAKTRPMSPRLQCGH